MSIEEFTEECTKQISSLQDEFRKLYDLNSYERWHFDEDFGVFISSQTMAGNYILNIHLLARSLKKLQHGNGLGTMNISKQVNEEVSN